MAYNMKRGNSAVPFKELGSSPAKHGEKDPGGHKNDEAHKAWHKKNRFQESEPANKDGSGNSTKSYSYKAMPTERDFSKHNVAARKTEGTIEEQEAKRKANKPE